MSGFQYRVPSQFTLSISGSNVQSGYLPSLPSGMAYYITGIDLQLIGASAVAVASIVGVPTSSAGFGFHVQQGPAMPYIADTFNPPIAMQPGATVGLYLPTPPVSGGTWNAHLYGFCGNPQF